MPAPQLVSVKFFPSDHPEHVLRELLVNTLRSFEEHGLIDAAHVEYVVPEQDGEREGYLFIVSFTGDIEHVKTGLLKLNEVRYTYSRPSGAVSHP